MKKYQSKTLLTWLIVICVVFTTIFASTIPASAERNGYSIDISVASMITNIGNDKNGNVNGTYYQIDTSGNETGATGFDEAVSKYRIYLPSYAIGSSCLTVETKDSTDLKYKTTLMLNGKMVEGITGEKKSTFYLYGINPKIAKNNLTFTAVSKDGKVKRVYHFEILLIKDAPVLERITGDKGFIKTHLEKSNKSIEISTKKSGESCTLTLKASKNAKIYTKKEFKEENLLKNNQLAWSGKEISVYVAYSTGEYSTYTLCAGVDQGGYHFPNAVTEYRVGPGQFGVGSIEKTLTYRGPLSLLGSCTGTFYEGKVGESWMNGATLGNFGGYVTYCFDDLIMNNANNPYGIDFIVYGNSSAYNNDGRNTMAFAEPGQVWVSQDGKQWYAIAGSDHYKDSTIWDYEMTYHNTGTSISKYTNNQGVTVPTPVSTVTKSSYNKDEANKNEKKYTLKGIFLNYDDSIVGSWAFGYGDTHNNVYIDKFDELRLSPYREDQYHDAQGDPVDISWAVDTEGIPVKLDSIKYVKIQNAVFKDAGSIGEKSPEINAVIGIKPECKPVGVTKGPVSIKLNGKELALKADKKKYDVDMTSYFRIEVNGGEDTNVYINEMYGTKRTFATPPKKGIIRIIVQKDKCEPQIYYLVDKNSGKKHNVSVPPMNQTSLENNLEKDIHVCVGLEKFTLGQGYVMEPIIVAVPKGAPAAEALKVALEKEKILYKSTGTPDYQFYLSAVEDENETVNVPQYIKDALKEDLSAKKDKEFLGEFDFSQWSGWMYAVNNQFPSIGSSEYKLKDGDVVRYQFSLYGYGADIGAGNEDWRMKNLKELRDKDSLTWRIAEINSLPCKKAILALGNNQKYYDEALEVVKKIDSTQSDIEKALNGIKEIGMEKEIRDHLKITVVKDEENGHTVYNTKAKIGNIDVSDFIYKTKVAIPFMGKMDENMILCNYESIPYGNDPKPEPIAAGKWNKKQNVYEIVVSSTGKYEFKSNGTIVFKDIAKNPAQKDILFLAQRNILNGYGKDLFTPERILTRGEAFQMLASLSGEELRYNHDEAWYYPAAQWTVAKGLIDMGTDGLRVNEAITKKEMNDMLNHYLMMIKNVKTPKVNFFSGDNNGKVKRWEAADAVVSLINHIL